MTRFNIVLAVFSLVGGSIFSQSAIAQSSYSPQGSTISPWMGLFQKNTGALDNYHSFVRPQMDLNQTLQMQNAALSGQAAGLQTLNTEMLQGPSGMMPTGQGATFMNYSHYYAGNRQLSHPGAPRAAAARPAAPNMRSPSGMPQ